MIVEYIRYEVTEPEQVLTAYAAARAALDESPHCLAYELAYADDEPRCFILRIEWDSAEGHLQGFRTSPGFAPFFAAVRPLLGLMREMRHYAVTDVAARKSPPA
jgi:quinol monooxygenase YgiN